MLSLLYVTSLDNFYNNVSVLVIYNSKIRWHSKLPSIQRNRRERERERESRHLCDLVLFLPTRLLALRHRLNNNKIIVLYQINDKISSSGSVPLVFIINTEIFIVVGLQRSREKLRVYVCNDLLAYIAVRKWAASWQNQQNDMWAKTDQPGYPPSLMYVFALRSMGS